MPDGSKQSDGAGGLATALKFPLGVSAAQLVVYDDRGALGSDTVTVQVVDTTPPQITVSDLAAERCSVGQVVTFDLPEVHDACSSDDVTLIGLVTERNGIVVNPPLDVSTGAGDLPPATYKVRWTATDPSGNSSTAEHYLKVRGGPVVFGTEAFKLGNNTKIFSGSNWGSAMSAGASKSEIGVEAQVGFVASRGGLDARDRSKLYFGGITAGQFQKGNDVFLGAPVAVGLPAFPQVPQLETSTFSGGTSVNVEPDTFASISPGSFGSISVKSRATLTLAPGVYNIQSLTLEPQAILRLSASTPSTQLRIQSQLIVRGSFQGPTQSTQDYLRIDYAGSAPLTVESPIGATLVAPAADVALGPANPVGSVFAGQFVGRRIEVRPSVTIMGATSTCGLPSASATSCTDGVSSLGETDVDCGGVCGATCLVGQDCLSLQDCASNVCSSGTCAVAAPPCNPGASIDLGTPGTQKTVTGASCLKVQQGYPAWWGNQRVMQLQSMHDGTYPISGTWESTCTGGGGSFVLDTPWSSAWFGPTSSLCATMIRLNGQASPLTLRYY